MGQRESSYVKKIRAFLSDFLTFKISDPYQKGLPDIWCVKQCKQCGKGKLALLEAKTKDGKLTQLQERYLRYFRERGCFAEEIREGVGDAETIQRLREY